MGQGFRAFVHSIDLRGPHDLRHTFGTRLGEAGVTCCLCPTTERDLADGIGGALALGLLGDLQRRPEHDDRVLAATWFVAYSAVLPLTCTV